MKQTLIAAVSILLLAASVSAQQDPGSNPVPLYENFGVVDTSQPSPQIDALAFANYGFFSVTGTPFLTEFPYTLLGIIAAVTANPYDFQNTLNFTNTGTMTSVTGFRLDTVSTNGLRRPANNIVNKNGATIQGQNFVMLSSTNVENQGLLSSTSLGMIQIKGKNLNLNRGGLLINSLDDFYTGGCIFGGSPFITPTNFIPDFGITDAQWSIGTNNGFRVDRFLTVNPDGTVRVVLPQLTLNTARAFVFTNAVSPTNWLVDAVFVQHVDPKIATRVRFYPSTQPTNDYKTAVVELRSFETNVVTGNTIIHQLYLLDKLSSETNFVLLTNLTTVGTYMPSPYVVSRATPCEFTTAVGGNAQITANLFYEPGFCVTNASTNMVEYTNVCVSSGSNLATNLNARYSAQVANGAALPAVAGATVTNLTGRVEIEADNLDLTRTRIRGEGLISIKTKHLVGSTGAIVDVPNLNYDLGSTNGTLLVTNLTKTSVERFGGGVVLASAIWTNQILVATNSVSLDPMDTNVPPTLTITNMVTNVVTVGYHVFLVSDQMTTFGQGVIVHDFNTHGTNVTIGDAMNVSERFFTDAENFTLTGSISLGQLIPNWNAALAPNLKNFTNSGTLSLFSSANFGSDRAQPYASFVNSGSIFSFNFSIRADYVENSGLLSADGGSGSISINAKSTKLQGGQFDAGGDIRFQGDSLKFRNHTQTSRNIYFSVTNSISDSGEGSGNTLNCIDGFHLTIKPASGDLLGTTLHCTAARFANSVSTWSAEDRGATSAGYTNNVAVGRLILDGGLLSLQTLSGTGTKNAIYVDFLQFAGETLKDFKSNMEISDNLVVYFADSNLPVEQLDGQFNGRLRWVRSFAGPNSSVDVLGSNGQTVKMNRPLRESTSIDSDGDGTVNKYDLTPLGGTAMTSVTIVNSPAPTAFVSWDGKAGVVYDVEYATNLNPSNWQLLVRYPNTATTDGVITIKDPVTPGAVQRYYRVRYTPQ